MRLFALALTAVCLLAAFGTHASTTDPHPQIDVQTILGKQQEIRAEVDAGKGRYKDIEPTEREELYKQQATISSLLQGKTLLTDLPERDRIAVFNALEKVSSILTKTEDERLVCERTKPIGSNRPLTVCLTVAQRREAREIGKNQVEFRDQKCIKVGNACDFNAGTSAGGSVQSDISRP